MGLKEDYRDVSALGDVTQRNVEEHRHQRVAQELSIPDNQEDQQPKLKKSKLSDTGESASNDERKRESRKGEGRK